MGRCGGEYGLDKTLVIYVTTTLLPQPRLGNLTEWKTFTT